MIAWMRSRDVVHDWSLLGISVDAVSSSLFGVICVSETVVNARAGRWTCVEAGTTFDEFVLGALGRFELNDGVRGCTVGVLAEVVAFVVD